MDVIQTVLTKFYGLLNHILAFWREVLVLTSIILYGVMPIRIIPIGLTTFFLKNGLRKRCFDYVVSGIRILFFCTAMSFFFQNLGGNFGNYKFVI